MLLPRRYVLALLGASLLSSCSPLAPSGLSAEATSVPAPAPPPSSPSRDIRFVLRVQGKPAVVLSQEVSAAWTQGEGALVPGEEALTVRKEVHLASLPPELRAEIGKTVALVGIHGNMCTARIGAPVALARLVPEGPIADAVDAADTADTAADARTTATRIWESEIADHQLVADLTPLRGDCEGALYARAATDTRAWAEGSPPTAPQERIARAAFRALPQYREVLESRDPEGAELPVSAAGEPSVRIFDTGGARYYFVSEGEESNCGAQNLGALFRADRAETPRELELIAVSYELAGETVGLVYEAGTEEVHVLYTDYELRIRALHEPDARRTVRVPFEGCGC